MEVKNFRAKRQFAFTDKEVKARCEEDNGTIEYTDSLCTGLDMITGKYGNGSYVLSTSYKGKSFKKTIGNVWRMSVEEARDIVRNIQLNKDEFMANELPWGKLLFVDFKENGFYPRKPAVVEDTSLSSLSSEIEKLRAENALLNKKLKAIENIVLFNEVDDDTASR